MSAPSVCVLDFETAGIERRPAYPPLPVGVSIKHPSDRAPKYYAWGHPTENNCDRETGYRAVRAAFAGAAPVLCQNAKFDYDVALVHCGIAPVPWHHIHDTMFLLFLDAPHEHNLSLKPSAERLLGMPPEEQDAVCNWLLENQKLLKSDGLLPASARITGSTFGAWICLAPGKLVGRYANGDVDRTLKLFRLLYPRIVAAGMLVAYDRERRLMPHLLRNETEGVRTDLEKLQRDLPLYEAAIVKCDTLLRKKLKTPDLDFNKDAEVAVALDSVGAIERWSTTKTGRLSVSRKALTIDTYARKYVALFHLLGYRNKLEVTLANNIRPWAKMGGGKFGRVYPGWNQTRGNASGGARTGRLSGSPNLMAIAKDLSDKGDQWVHPGQALPGLPLVREYLLPDAGDVWCRRDYNQQELRLMAHFSNGVLMNQYLEDPRLDVHNFVRKAIEAQLGREITRTIAKTLQFAALYGQGLKSMAEALSLPIDEIKTLRALQMQTLPDLKDLLADIKNLAKTKHPIVTWGGRAYYKEESREIDGRMVDFGYKLINTLIQGSAADVTKEALCRWFESGPHESRFLLTVHDEINFSAPKRALKSEMLAMREIMMSVEVNVPMISDGESGPNWGAMRPIKEPAPSYARWLA